MENNYMIPANSKRSQLIFGLFRGVDLTIFAVGAIVTFILLVAVPLTGSFIMILKLLPAGIATFLVMPIPYYHNVLVFIREIFEFYSNRRIYLWKGWCLSDEYGEESRQ